MTDATGAVSIRPATVEDVPEIVALLADDPLGATRESPDDLAPYLTAFAALETDPHQVLVVAEREGRVVGTLQLTFIAGLSHRGATRAQIEGVRVRGTERGGGLGGELVRWAVEEARAAGCAIVQLTSDRTRVDAHRFYERLGFQASHVGFKMTL
ncbi:Ribosomal protein S18 acetylase RimI [Streptoalloteichus tenebrarius]|uniref:Ribosomal protein S18 acetylase RimI n=1 Tax=Streptoalloteichus tenebrarius (strain ATCC 17920 / DSM 40477 / JCM 4838 / CBS 697.72 / NBRC 16177 / NCIMB 11028 / NRRL B-12390 / A12253. 1 / ISP 5477) TaxID=1933 RepID=A0ABT1HUI0_STRSD|nr:GNAT family N-acetyltransferase [Streptoalloteichus tenebrarius]MCP2259183.1 Ribosomal protein S18 acetylase RimI [Streptoalloteichus tenebrarius]